MSLVCVFQGILSIVGQHCNMNGDSLVDSFCSSTIILVLSNLCSNVPTVMLLATKVEDVALDDESEGLDGNVKWRPRVAWLILAWASTVAGNFALPGSIANLIVAEKAALHFQSRPKYHAKSTGLTFWVHFRYASWTTIPIMLIGSAAIFYTQMPDGPALEPIN
jgi:Na+/H+ antiporter NhaD/arsenite permease-like protein